MIAAVAEWSTVIAVQEQREGKKLKTGHRKWPAVYERTLVGTLKHYPQKAFILGHPSDIP